jgi:branched-chain amino acid transport system substrate-binding protein
MKKSDGRDKIRKKEDKNLELKIIHPITKQRNFVVNGLTIFTLITLFICSFSVPASLQAKELRIGMTAPLTGPVAEMAADAVKHVQLVFDEINAAGGLTLGGENYTLKFFYEDDKYNALAGRTAVEKLVNKDQIKFIINVIPSAVIMSYLPITEPLKIISISDGAVHDMLKPEYHWTFKCEYGGQASVSSALFSYVAKTHPKAKTVYGIASDDETGRATVEEGQRVALKLGFKEAGRAFVDRQATDMYPVATKIIAAKPDIVNMLNFGQPALLLKALYEQGYTGLRLITAPNMVQLPKIAGPKAIEGVIFGGTFPDDPMMPRMYHETVKKFKQKYGKEPDGGQWPFSSAQYWLIAALKKANSIEPEKVRQALMDVEAVDTVIGKLLPVVRPDYFNLKERRASMMDMPIGTIKDGKIVLLSIIPIAEGIKNIEKIYNIKMR